MDKEQAKAKLKELVNQFSKANLNKDHVSEQNEEWIKWNYIEPLLEILGWGRSDIEKEYRVLKGRADYLLKIGNEETLVVEAKKAGVSLAEEEGRQAVSYAYHRKIKFAVLTNFKEIRVYHALSNIKNIDKNLLKFDDGAIFRLSFDQFVDKFDKLFLLSRESFENGTIYKLLSKKDEKALKPIDESILDDLLEIRELLSKDIKKLRTYLTPEQIDEAVQIFIDRLIFMRSVEDRGLEGKNFLQGLVKDYREGRVAKRLWSVLQEQFRLFDKEYNSKLFDHSILEDEKNIFFDDDTLQRVILITYNGTKDNQYRYMFDEIPGDLLGNIYEQYLGTILQSTDKRVTLKEGGGKRKKMGIYYTPSYITDYIVKNTVGEYIKDKTIDEILNINIVDPACGSGSFLIRAFKELCTAVEERLKKGERAKMVTFHSYKDRLSLSQKAAILSNCIYGVDLDEKAVELAQLNLLLRLLEEETPDTHKRLLPNLRENIKCGNSLIDDPKVAGDKAFKWEAQFPDVFRSGGFDVVIGNPPYIRIHQFNEKTKKAFSKYSSATGQYDIYVLFIEKSLNLLKEGGCLGFIVSNKFLVADYGIGLRKIILNKSKIRYLLDVSNLNIFKEASVYPLISIFEKSNDRIQIIENKVAILQNIQEASQIINPAFNSYIQGDFLKNSDLIINITFENIGLIEKIEKKSVKLQELSKITRGFRPPSKNLLSTRLDMGCYRYFVGKDLVGAYAIKWSGNIVKYDQKEINESKPLEVFLQPKILIRDIGKRFNAYYDEEGYLCLKTIYFLYNVRNIDIRNLLAIINSKLMLFYFRSKFSVMHIQGGYLRFRKQFLDQLPINVPEKSQEQKIISLVNQMLSLQKQLHKGELSGNEKERLEQQIKNLDYEIDQEVYKLYGITREEQKIIEESLK